MRISARLTIATLLLLASLTAAAVPAGALADAAKVEWQWGVKIPLRDGVHLNATLYKPAGLKEPRPCLFTLTPYIGQSYHDRGMYFAAHGYPFLTVDVRGRGNSEGVFQPLIQEAKDGYDVVEWLAQQPYCNGKVSMWGGSYAGYDQWTTAKEFPRTSRPSYPWHRRPPAWIFRRATTFSRLTICSGSPLRAVIRGRTGCLATTPTGSGIFAAGSNPAPRTENSTPSSAIRRRFFRSGSAIRTSTPTGIHTTPAASSTPNCSCRS